MNTPTGPYPATGRSTESRRRTKIFTADITEQRYRSGHISVIVSFLRLIPLAMFSAQMLHHKVRGILSHRFYYRKSSSERCLEPSLCYCPHTYSVKERSPTFVFGMLPVSSPVDETRIWPVLKLNGSRPGARHMHEL